MTLDEVIDLIQLWIVENGNEEITADVLRPILEAMVNQPNDLIGDLDDLDTTYNTDLVGAINEVKSIADGNTGIVIHYGEDTPLVTPPLSFGLGDFFAQVISPSTAIVTFWQYNGIEWVEIRAQKTKTVLKFVSLVGITTTGKSQVKWMAEAINAAISNGAVYECKAGEIMEFYINLPTISTGSGAVSLRRVFTRLLTGATSVTSATQSDLMPDGWDVYNIENEFIIDLGNIGTDDVWDAFNADVDQPFDMTDDMFVQGIQDSEPKLWQWLGGEGSFGSTGTPAVEGDFLDLTAQPNAPSIGSVYSEPYATTTAMIANPTSQDENVILVVTDASADTNITFPIGETKKHAFYKLKGDSETGTIVDYVLVSAPYAVNVRPSLTASTGTVIDLSNSIGNECNMLAANTNSAFTLTNIKPGGEATVLINRATEPTISGATKIAGHAFQASTNMHMKVKCRQSGIVQYYFLKL